MKQFEFIKVQKPQKSVLDLSHEVKLTGNMGDLIPVLCQEVLPGDNFRINQETLIRAMPMLAPIMHRVNVYTHFFFVPNRIIWEDWENFITGGKLGLDTPNHPKLKGTIDDWLSEGLSIGSLADYLGIPVNQFENGKLGQLDVSQLPFRAYQKIYDDYYKDQTLSESFEQLTNSEDLIIGTDDIALLTDLRKRCWEKDYFTSALPWTQRGSAVKLPLGESATVRGTFKGEPVAGAVMQGADGVFNVGGNPIQVNTPDGLYADLKTATAASVNDLRRAFSLQRWLEKNARAGARYIEQILMHFGVKSSDARLQRSEYLGGGKFPIQISEVLQTSQAAEDNPLGTMAGHGVSGGQTTGFSRFFEEHGFIIGIMSIIPRTAYSQGLPKIFNKFDKFDYYFPDFAHIGEQEVKTIELWLDPDGTYNDTPFGYQSRFSEYRTNVDRFAGEMRTTLDFWHLGRKFQGQPLLNEDFVKCLPSTRIFPVEDASHKFIMQLYMNIQAIRPVAKYGDPI